MLAVHEDYYEEKLDHNLAKLLPADLRVEKVSAFGVTKPRMIGDIGLRGFFQLYKKAKEIIKSEQIDFLYIPIPPFYVALLGRMLHKSTGVKYGIDYIDPWVHKFPNSDHSLRHRLSEYMANVLEPKAIKNACVITGVAAGYYKGVQERHPDLAKTCAFGAMPYGGEKTDHEKLKSMDLKPYLFEKKENKIQLVYAGAMLPKAYKPLEEVLKAISADKEKFEKLEINFIGTGSRANDPESYNIKPLAEKYGLWEKVIFEYPARIPYLDVLIHLEAADGVFILGSTEAHYTPSKVYQGVLSEKPILAILHKDSTACQVIKSTKVGKVLDFDGEEGLSHINQSFSEVYIEYVDLLKSFDPANCNLSEFDQYSAYQVTKKLVECIDEGLALCK